MVEICPTDFSRKCISRIVGNLEMPVDASVVRINPAVMPFAEKVFTFGGIKVLENIKSLDPLLYSKLTHQKNIRIK